MTQQLAIKNCVIMAEHPSAVELSNVDTVPFVRDRTVDSDFEDPFDYITGGFHPVQTGDIYDLLRWSI